MFKKVLCYFFATLFLLSCKSDLKLNLEKQVASFEAANLHNLLHIEYEKRNNTEFYSYYTINGKYCEWLYKNDSLFISEDNRKKLNAIIQNTDEFAKTVKTNVEKLKFELIAQSSSWPTKVVKFWIADNRYFVYISTDINIENDDKNILKSELKSSEKITDQWYFRTLKVCRNK